MAKISREARAELLGVVGTRYRAAGRRDKTLILDEFVRVTGYHRKHAVRVLQGRVEVQKPRTMRDLSSVSRARAWPLLIAPAARA